MPSRLLPMSGTVAAIAVLVLAVWTAATVASPALASHVNGGTSLSTIRGSMLVLPIMNPTRGRKIFVDKGCVACHAVNGVGGHDAPNMDAHRNMGLVNPFDFAAKMWNHAPAMIAAQEGALGEQIYFTGQELADMIGFVHDDEAQHGFSEKDLTARARKMMDHGHGGTPAPKAHAEELGHHDDAGTKTHGH